MSHDEKTKLLTQLASPSLSVKLDALARLSADMGFETAAASETELHETVEQVELSELVLPPKRILRSLVPVILASRDASSKKWRFQSCEYITNLLRSRHASFDILLEVLQSIPLERESPWGLVAVVEISLVALQSPLGYNSETEMVSRPIVEVIVSSLQVFDRLGTSHSLSKLRSALNRLESLLSNALKPPVIASCFLDVCNKTAAVVPMALLAPYIPQKEIVVDFFVNKVLQAKTVPTEFVISLYKGFLQDLTPELWADISGHLIKLIKKSPESASMLTCMVLSSVNNDLSVIVQDALVLTVIRMLKSAIQDVRKRGVSIVRSCVLKCNAHAPLCALLISGLDGCLGKVAGSSLTLPYQRAAVFLSISSAATSLKSREAEIVDAVVRAVLPALFAAAEREAEENTRVLAMRAVGCFVSLYSPSAGVIDTVTFFKSGMAKSKASTVLYLCALILATGKNIEAISQYSEIVPVLQSIVKEGIKRPSTGDLDVVFSVYLLLKFANTSPSVLEGINLSKLFTPGSCLCHVQLLRILQDVSNEDYVFDETVRASCCDLLAESLIGILIFASRIGLKELDALLVVSTHSFSLLENNTLVSSSADITFPDMLVAVMLVAERDVISRMTAEIRLFSSSCSVDKLLFSLVSLLYTISTHEVGRKLASSLLGVSNEEAGVVINSSVYRFGALKKAPHSSRVIEILSIITAQDKKSTPLGTISRLLIGSHPLVSSSCDMSLKLWRAQAATVCNFDDSYSREMLQEYLIPLLTSNIDVVASAARTALTLTIIDGNKEICSVIKSSIIPRLLSYIQNSSLEYSDEDQELFLNPSKRIKFRGSAAVVVDESEIRITNADRAGKRGKFGGDLVEDEAWFEQIKAEKMKKLALQKSAALGGDVDKKEKDMDAKMEQMKESLDKISSTLMALSTFGRFTTLLSDNVESVVSLFIDILRVPFVTTIALREVTEFVSIYYSEPADLAASLLAASVHIHRHLRKGETLQTRLVSLGTVSAPIVRVLRQIYTQYVVRNKPLSPILFHLLLPLLHGVFLMPSVVPGCELAYSVLDSCWALDPVTKPAKTTVIETCLRVIGNFRIEHGDPDRFLIKLITEDIITMRELGPLLGDFGLLSSSSKVKFSVLKALDTLPSSGPFEEFSELVQKIWLLCFDSDEVVRVLASEVWTRRGLQLQVGFSKSLLEFLYSQSESVRAAAGKAVGNGLLTVPGEVDAVCVSLKTSYVGAIPTKPVVESVASKSDSKAKAQKDDSTQHLREAISSTIAALGSSKCLEISSTSRARLEDRVLDLLTFILQFGVIDEAPSVRGAMLEAGRAIIDAYGQAACDVILQYLNTVVSRTPSFGEDLSEFDMRNEAAVILLGAAGKHLGREDPNVLKITRSMLLALKTPSEQVQVAVAESLVGLVSVLKGSEDAKSQLEELITMSVEGSSYGDRRGAALGIAAYTKGMGIPVLKQHDIVPRLKLLCEEGSVNARQGALLVFECLSERLGLLFEPYIITIMPVLLKSFSHASDHVREAAQMAAKTIMTKLSAHGVKQVLTPLLLSLPTETAWKSRQEAIRLLGTMAHCAPRQLAASLPQIVPKLVDAVSDSHPKVKESAKLAMADITAVIKNPEISQLIPVLLAALGDPANKTKDALSALLECEFMHSIDAPSLGILIPILCRALKDRSADLKRKSSAIMGNICTMISDAKIIVPYFPQMIPGLQNCIVDPIPDVRATSAKALGTLVRGVGEAELPELIPWLMDTLKTEVSPVERCGAAQGLAEVGLSLGGDRLVEIISAVTSLQVSPKAAHREGMIWALSFFPRVLGDNFAAHISDTLPIVLKSLSDDSEGVREVALRAGQVLVSSLGQTYTLELIPGLLDGLAGDDWRVRECATTLIGELLYLIGDTHALGVTDAEEDDAGLSSNSRVMSTIRAHIGDEPTNQCLAALYIARSDTSNAVRQRALQVWKSIVSNSPKTLKDVMSQLLSQVVDKLSGGSADMRGIASKALGDVCVKMGDFVLPIVVPRLQQGLQEGGIDKRLGVCMGLNEILSSSTKTQISGYLGCIIPALQTALCDISAEVRKLGSLSFQTMLRNVGPSAIEDVVPSLLEQVEDESDDSSLENNLAILGLRELVACRPRELMEYLLPELMAVPISAASAKTLGFIASAAGSQLNYQIGTIVSEIIPELSDTETEDPARHESIKDCAAKLMGAILSSGVNYLIDELGGYIDDDDEPCNRRWGCWLLEQFIRHSDADFEEYICIFLKYILERVTDSDFSVLQAAASALGALTTKVPMDVLVQHLEFIISSIRSTASDAKHRTGVECKYSTTGDMLLPIFEVPKALDTILPIFLHGLMNGSAHLRETAADGITELLKMCEPSVLKPVLIKTTGPLIRVAGDRFPSSVKAAILQTLSVLIDRGNVALKAFAPQLQTTFVKSLSDPLKLVRARAASGLGQLVSLTPKVDSLLTELSTAYSGAESSAIRGSILDAMTNVLREGGPKGTAVGYDKIKVVLQSGFAEEDDVTRSSALTCCQALCYYAEVSLVSELVISLSASRNSGSCIGCAAALSSSGDKSSSVHDMAFEHIQRGLISSDAKVKTLTVKAVGCMFDAPAFEGVEDRRAEFTRCSESAATAFIEAICRLSTDESQSVRKQAITAIKLLAKNLPDVANHNIVQCMAPLIIAVKDINIRIKTVAERAMRHLLRGGMAPGPINAYAAAVDSESASFVKDYARRVLAKLPEESDDEDGYADMWQ